MRTFCFVLSCLGCAVGATVLANEPTADAPLTVEDYAILVEGLGHKDPNIVDQCAARLEVSLAVHSLVRGLATKERTVAERAAKVLDRIIAARDFESIHAVKRELLDIATQEKYELWRRYAATRMVGHLVFDDGDKRALVATLLAGLDDEVHREEAVRLARKLGSHASSAVPKLAAIAESSLDAPASDRSLTFDAIRALMVAQPSGASARSVFRKLVAKNSRKPSREQDSQLQQFIAADLREANGKSDEWIAELEPLLDHHDSTIRTAVTKAILTIDEDTLSTLRRLDLNAAKTQAAFRRLMKHVELNRELSVPFDARLQSFLIEIGDGGPSSKPWTGELQALLKHDRPAIRLEAALALLKINSANTSASPVLAALLSHSDIQVRERAIERIASLGARAKAIAPEHEKAQRLEELVGRATRADTFPRVVLHTTLGDITVRLNREKAPLTVENFLRYVDEGFYTGTISHEVRRDDVIIAGGYTGDLKEKPATHQSLRNEAHNGLKNIRGTISMVREPAVIDSSASQFFFNLGNNDYLDPQPLQPRERPADPWMYGYCVFGEVIEGMHAQAPSGDQVRRASARN